MGKDFEPVDAQLLGDYVFYASGGDLDNKVKAFQDSMSKIVVKDDKLFSHLLLQRVRIPPGEKERIGVRVYKRESK